MIRAALTLALLAIPAAVRADAPAGDAVLAIAPGEVAAIQGRLRGQRTTVAADRRSIAIDDIAGEGRPWIGVVERRGAELWLRTASGAARLTGPLARPRIAGPGYTVWVIGTATAQVIAVRRIGVLRRPPLVVDTRRDGVEGLQRRTSVEWKILSADDGTKPSKRSPDGSE